MPAQTTNLYLLEDLEDVGRTSELAESDLETLHAVADWIKTFVVEPHKDLGRSWTVCPSCLGHWNAKTLWLAPEQIADRDVPAVVELMNGYKRLLLDTRPTEGDDVIYNVIIFGPYYEGHEGTAIYNSSFRPFQSPVPFLFVRHGVTGDWKFFLDNEDWLNLWARRYGESGAQVLAEELRRLPWRAKRD